MQNTRFPSSNILGPLQYVHSSCPPFFDLLFHFKALRHTLEVDPADKAGQLLIQILCAPWSSGAYLKVTESRSVYKSNDTNIKEQNNEEKRF